jgi:predicted kinase
VDPGARRLDHPVGDRVIRWLSAGATEPVLRYPADALVVIGGPSGAGKSTLAERVLGDVLDPDEVRAALAAERGVPGTAVGWGEALARTRVLYCERLAAGRGAVLVTTAVRVGHRLGLAKDAAAHGVSCHALMLDADAELCRAGRRAQREERIPAGLFEHLNREWEAFRRELAAGVDPPGFASVTILDREAADALARIEFVASYQRTGTP